MYTLLDDKFFYIKISDENLDKYNTKKFKKKRKEKK